MLISIRHKFVFIENRHAGSAAMCSVLTPYAEINRTGSHLRRCISWADIRPEYGFVFEQSQLKPSEFFKFGIIREPVDWVMAFYRCRFQPGEPGSDNASQRLSFADWWGRNAASLAGWDQAVRFSDFDRNCAMDMLIPFADIGTACELLQQRLALPLCGLPEDNARTMDDLTEKQEVSDELAASIHLFFAETTSLYQLSMQRWERRSGESKAASAQLKPLPVVLRAQLREAVLMPSPAGSYSVAGLVLLQPDAGLDFKLTVIGAEKVGAVRTGIASAWFSKRYPGHAQAGRAKFVIEDLHITPGSTVSVRLGVGTGEWDWLTLQA